MAKKATQTFKITELPPRSLQRLLEKAQKTKIVLSANKKSDFFVESLHESKDFYASISREEFESLIEPLLSSIHTLVLNVLKKSNLQNKDLKGVEIVGAGWRVPRVQQEIETIIAPHDLGQHVNGDEGAAFGATLVAANASSSFRIKDTKFADLSAYGYLVKLKNVTTERTQEWKTKEVVKIGGRFGGFRTLSTRSCDDIVAELFEVDGEGVQTLLTKYDITGIKEACQVKHKEHGLARVNFVFSAAPTGVVALDRAVAQWEETYLAPAPKSTTTTTTSAPSDKKDDSSTTTTTKATTTTTEEPKMIEQTRKHTMKCKVATTESLPRPMTSDEIESAKKRLSEFEAVDLNAIKLAKARNNLESFVYSTRSDLDTDIIQQVSTKEAREALSGHLSEIEDWLYDDGITAPFEEFEKRLLALKDELAPVVTRAAETKGREALTQLAKAMGEKIEQSLSAEMMEKIDFNGTLVEKFQTTWKEFNVWFDGKKQEQQKKSLTEVAAYSTLEVKERLHKVSKELESLMKSAKIKIPPTVAPERNNNTSTNATGEDAGEKADNQTSTESSSSSDATETPTPAPRRKEFSKPSSKTADEL